MAFPPTFLFEPLIEDITVRPPPLERIGWLSKHDVLKLPKSTDEATSHVVLRPGDIVDFGRYAFQTRLDIHRVEMAPEVPAMAPEGHEHRQQQHDPEVVDGIEVAQPTGHGDIDDTIQVRSSDKPVENDGSTAEAADADMETEDDEGLDDPSSLIKSARTPGQVEDTPATSYFTNSEIKETPARLQSGPSDGEPHEPFSTAPEELREDDEEDGSNIKVTSSAVDAAVDPKSPLAGKSGDSQAQDIALDDAAEATPIDLSRASLELGEGNFATASPAGKTIRKYGKGQKRQAAKSAKAVTRKRTVSDSAHGNKETELEPQQADDEEQEDIIAVDSTRVPSVGADTELASDSDMTPVHDAAATHTPAAGTTSDPYDEHDVSEEVSRRTTGVPAPKGKKRGRPIAAEASVKMTEQKHSVKRVKKTSPVAAPETSSDEDVAPRSRHGKARASGKQAQVAREDTDEEIIVVSASKGLTAKGKITPSPQVRIQSKAPNDTPGSTAMSGRAPKLLFSHSKVNNNKGVMAWLRQQGATEIEEIPTKRSHFICVVQSGTLATTAKILRTLAMGKAVVTDDWVTDSKAEGQLLEPDDYMHEDLEASIKADRGRLFKGHILFFTKKLVQSYGQSGWQSIQALCHEAGANLVDHGVAGSGRTTALLGKTIFFGNDADDTDVKTLALEHDFTVYHKDLLTQSVLRGELDLESDEFVIQPSTSVVKRGRGRKR